MSHLLSLLVPSATASCLLAASLSAQPTPADVEGLADRVLRVGRLDQALVLSELPERPEWEPGGTLDTRRRPSSGTASRPTAQPGGGVIPFGNGDTDGDGLTDGEELAGWDIVIDLHGYGTDALGSLLTIRHVTSNYLVADSDGDGLSDLDEFYIGSDPSDDDTDDDQLLDAVEWNKEFTSTNSVDTDGDARGPDANLAPNVSLFDGWELDASTPRTSPTLDDTDGDGRTDYEEFDHALFDPLIAELPTARIEVAGELDLRLDVEYAEAVVQEQAYETSLSQATTTTTGAEATSSIAITAGWTQEFSHGYEEAVGGQVGSGGWAVGGSVSANQQFTEGSYGEFAKEDSFTVSSEQAATTQATSSQYLSDSQEYTETAASGSLTLPIQVLNDSDFAYTLTNLAVSLLHWTPDASGEGPGEYRAVGTIHPAVESFTLAPGEETPIITLDSGDLNVDVVKAFLSMPDSLVLQPASFDMENAEGVDFDFITEVTLAQTALVEIDYGDGVVDSYRVATNVDREGFDYQGITMDEVMKDVLGLEYFARKIKNQFGVDVLGTGPDGVPQSMFYVNQIGDVFADAAWDNPDTTSMWLFETDADLDLAVTGPGVNGVLQISFPTVVLQAGDSLRLIYSVDMDDDGLWSGQESTFGSSDTNADTDGDGLNDRLEAALGWQSPQGSGHFVFSDPRSADTDHDGLTDDQEWAIWSDPRNPDTDGDGVLDGADPTPTEAGVTLYVTPGGGGDGSSWASPADFAQAIGIAVAANSSPETDVAQIWCSQGLHDIGNNTLDMPRGNVAVLGGFSVGDAKVGDRNPDPTTNLTTLTSSNSFPGGTGILKWDNGESWDELAGTLDGFTVTGAGPDPQRILDVNDGTVRLRNLLVVGNHTQFGAVGIFSNGRIEAEQCLFLQNHSQGDGGAVFDGGVSGSSFVDCEFSLNVAGQRGGAIFRPAPDINENLGLMVFERCTFFGNQVYWDGVDGFFNELGGGAVFTDDGGSFVDCDFVGNRTGSAKVDEEFLFGTDGLRGGAIRYEAEAGGIGNYAVELRLVNCRMFDNLAGMGGAIFVENFVTSPSYLTCINSTIVGNTSTKLGGPTVPGENQSAGGIHINVSPVQTVNVQLSMRNSILWDNVALGFLTPDQVPLDKLRKVNIKIEDFSSLEADVAFSTIPGLYDDPPALLIGNGNTDDDPLFLHQVAGNLRLATGSPAIDTGMNAVDIEQLVPGFQPLPLFDLDGNWRIVEGDGFGTTPTVDRGAYEYQP